MTDENNTNAPEHAEGGSTKKDALDLGELSGLGPMPEDLEIDLNANGYAMSAGSEWRATERPALVCGRMAYEVLQAHMPNERTDLPSPARVR